MREVIIVRAVAIGRKVIIVRVVAIGREVIIVRAVAIEGGYNCKDVCYFTSSFTTTILEEIKRSIIATAIFEGPLSDQSYCFWKLFLLSWEQQPMPTGKLSEAFLAELGTATYAYRETL